MKFSALNKKLSILALFFLATGVLGISCKSNNNNNPSSPEAPAPTPPVKKTLAELAAAFNPIMEQTYKDENGVNKTTTVKNNDNILSSKLALASASKLPTEDQDKNFKDVTLTVEVTKQDGSAAGDEASAMKNNSVNIFPHATEAKIIKIVASLNRNGESEICGTWENLTIPAKKDSKEAILKQKLIDLKAIFTPTVTQLIDGQPSTLEANKTKLKDDFQGNKIVSDLLTLKKLPDAKAPGNEKFESVTLIWKVESLYEDYNIADHAEYNPSKSEIKITAHATEAVKIKITANLKLETESILAHAPWTLFITSQKDLDTEKEKAKKAKKAKEEAERKEAERKEAERKEAERKKKLPAKLAIEKFERTEENLISKIADFKKGKKKVEDAKVTLASVKEKFKNNPKLQQKRTKPLKETLRKAQNAQKSLKNQGENAQKFCLDHFDDYYEKIALGYGFDTKGRTQENKNAHIEEDHFQYKFELDETPAEKARREAKEEANRKAQKEKETEEAQQKADRDAAKDKEKNKADADETQRTAEKEYQEARDSYVKPTNLAEAEAAVMKAEESSKAIKKEIEDKKKDIAFYEGENNRFEKELSDFRKDNDKDNIRLVEAALHANDARIAIAKMQLNGNRLYDDNKIIGLIAEAKKAKEFLKEVEKDKQVFVDAEKAEAEAQAQAQAKAKAEEEARKRAEATGENQEEAAKKAAAKLVLKAALENLAAVRADLAHKDAALAEATEQTEKAKKKLKQAKAKDAKYKKDIDNGIPNAFVNEAEHINLKKKLKKKLKEAQKNEKSAQEILNDVQALEGDAENAIIAAREEVLKYPVAEHELESAKDDMDAAEAKYNANVLPNLNKLKKATKALKNVKAQKSKMQEEQFNNRVSELENEIEAANLALAKPDALATKDRYEASKKVYERLKQKLNSQPKQPQPEPGNDDD